MNAHQRDGPASLSSAYEDWYEATSDGRFSEVRASEYRSLADGGASSFGDGGSSRAHADPSENNVGDECCASNPDHYILTRRGHDCTQGAMGQLAANTLGCQRLGEGRL